jgi:uncharacterized YccA/Bax inhibitor family protein
MFRTSNPTLNDRVFNRALEERSAGVMTLGGTVAKTFFLTALLVISAMVTWQRMGSESPPAWIGGALKFGWIVPCGIALVIGFKPLLAGMLSPVYAVTKGVIVGIVSYVFESQFEGIVLSSVMLTCGVLCALLFAYATRLIRPSENFKLGIFAATGGIFLFYLVSWGLSFFGVDVPLIHGNGGFAIGFSVFVVIIAALNLVLDFDFIENGAAAGAPKHMEWYGAFGLLVTLVWLYIEILRLLAKLRSRN